MNHHRMFSFIKRTDAILMLLNLLLLLFIVFVPFPTLLVAKYLQYRNAALLFNGTYVMIAICFNVLLRYAAHENRLLGKQVDQQQLQAMLGQYRFGPLAYLITFAITWISVPLSLMLNLLMAVFWALPARKSRSQTSTPASNDPEKIVMPEEVNTFRVDD